MSNTTLPQGYNCVMDEDSVPFEQAPRCSALHHHTKLQQNEPAAKCSQKLFYKIIQIEEEKKTLNLQKDGF